MLWYSLEAPRSAKALLTSTTTYKRNKKYKHLLVGKHVLAGVICNLIYISVYTRGCSASKHFKGCESINIIGNMKKECDCRQDLCNHSNQLVSRLLLYLIIFMTVYSLSMRRYI